MRYKYENEKTEMDYLDELIVCLKGAKRAVEPVPKPENFVFNSSSVRYRWTTISRIIRILLNDAIVMKRDWEQENK